MRLRIKANDFKSVTIPDMCEELGKSEVVQDFLRGRKLFCSIGDWIEAVATRLVINDEDFTCDEYGILRELDVNNSIVAFSKKGEEKILKFWENYARHDLVEPQRLFEKLIWRNDPKQDYELPSFDSIDGTPKLLAFDSGDFYYDE